MAETGAPPTIPALTGVAVDGGLRKTDLLLLPSGTVEVLEDMALRTLLGMERCGLSGVVAVLETIADGNVGVILALEAAEVTAGVAEASVVGVMVV